MKIIQLTATAEEVFGLDEHGNLYRLLVYTKSTDPDHTWQLYVSAQKDINT